MGTESRRSINAGLPPELAVVLDVARFRIRRLEMANLAAALAIMIALRLQVSDIGIRFGFGLLLNLLVYLNNDYFDRRRDLETPGRDASKTAYLHAHPQAAVRAQLGLLAVLAAIAWWHGHGLGAALVLGGGICAAYSAWLKRRPGVDVVAMIAWGAAMPLVGVPHGRADGYALVGQLALFSGVFETIQVMRDHEEDRRQGLKTTAVVLGLARCRVLLRVLLLASAVYAAWMFHAWVGLAAAAAMMIPIPADSTELGRYWNRVRGALGLTFVVQCGLIWMRAGGP